MLYNHIKLHDMDTVFFPSLLSDFGKGTLNLIRVWEFPEYLRLSLPSALRCVMSYLMQPDKQYACTDSIKETEWGTRMGGLYVHLHTSTRAQISTFWQAISLAVHILLHCLVKSHPLQPTPALQHDLACRALKNLSTNICFSAKAPLDVLRAVWWHALFGLITRFAKLWPQSPFPTLK